MPSFLFHLCPLSRFRLRLPLPCLALGDQHLRDLLMQAREHSHTHRSTGDEMPLQSLRGRLAILGRLGDGSQQGRLNEAEIEIRDALRNTDIGKVRRPRMGRRFAGLHADIRSDSLVCASGRLVYSFTGSRGHAWPRGSTAPCLRDAAVERKAAETM